MESIKITLPSFPGTLLTIFLKNFLVSLIVFETLFYLATTTKNIFCVKNVEKLAYLSAESKFYNNLIPLNEV